jgi:hypothetical protein
MSTAKPKYCTLHVRCTLYNVAVGCEALWKLAPSTYFQFYPFIDHVHPSMAHTESAATTPHDHDHGPQPSRRFVRRAHNNASTSNFKTATKKEKNLRYLSCTPSKNQQQWSNRLGHRPLIKLRRPNRRNHLRVRVRKIPRHKIFVRRKPLVPIPRTKRQTNPPGGK